MYTDVFHMYTSSGVREMAAVQQIRNQTLVMAKNSDYKKVVEEMRTIARLTGRQT